MVGKPRYVDVDVFIYWLGGHPVHGEKSREWVRKMEKAAPREYVTSSLTVYETLVILAGLTEQSLKNTKFVEGVVDAFTRLKGLAIEPLRSEDLTQAVKLMEKYGLDYEDSLHLAVALRVESAAVVTNDRDWDRTPIPRTF